MAHPFVKQASEITLRFSTKVSESTSTGVSANSFDKPQNKGKNQACARRLSNTAALVNHITKSKEAFQNRTFSSLPALSWGPKEVKLHQPSISFARSASVVSACSDDCTFLDSLINPDETEARAGMTSDFFSSRILLTFKDRDQEAKYRMKVNSSSAQTLMSTFWLYTLIMAVILFWRFNVYTPYVRYAKVVVLGLFAGIQFVFVTLVNMFVVIFRKDILKKKWYSRYFFGLCVIQIILSNLIIVLYDTYFTLGDDPKKRYTLGVMNAHVLIMFLNIRFLFLHLLIHLVHSLVTILACFVVLSCLSYHELGSDIILTFSCQYAFLFIVVFVLAVTGYIQEKMERFLFVDEERVKKNFEILENNIARTDRLISNILPGDFSKEISAKFQKVFKHRKKKRKLGSPSQDVIYRKFFDHVCVISVDICDYTRFSRTVSPCELISIINIIFTSFDNLAKNCGVSKLTTLGDCWVGFSCARNGEEDDRGRICHDSFLCCRLLFQMLNRLNSQYDWDFQITAGVYLSHGLVVLLGEKTFCFQLYGESVTMSETLQKECKKGHALFSKDVWHNCLELADSDDMHDVEAEAVVFELGSSPYDVQEEEDEDEETKRVTEAVQCKFIRLDSNEYLAHLENGPIANKDTQTPPDGRVKVKADDELVLVGDDKGDDYESVIFSPSGNLHGPSGLTPSLHSSTTSSFMTSTIRSANTEGGGGGIGVSHYVDRKDELLYSDLKGIEKMFQTFLFDKNFMMWHYFSHMYYMSSFLAFLQLFFFGFLNFCIVSMFTLFGTQYLFDWHCIANIATMAATWLVSLLSLVVLIYIFFSFQKEFKKSKPDLPKMKRKALWSIVFGVMNCLSFLSFVLAFGQLSAETSHFLDFFGAVVCFLAIGENSFNLSPIPFIFIFTLFSLFYAAVSTDFTTTDWFMNIFDSLHLVPLCLIGQLAFPLMSFGNRNVVLKQFINGHNFRVFKRKIVDQHHINMGLIQSFVPKFVLSDLLTNNGSIDDTSKQSLFDLYSVAQGGACFVHVEIGDLCAEKSTAFQTLRKVQRLCSLFVELERKCVRTECCKIKTFNEVFLAVCGVKSSKDVVLRMARFAYNAGIFLEGKDLVFRIGVSYGNFCGGVIG